MALGCVTMLLLATSLMMSFSIANAVHERIRLQSHADAMAFSMAVVEARAMNYLAYSNRAIAAAFVSMTSVHAYAAIVDSSVPLMNAGLWAMFMSTVKEWQSCDLPSDPKHCIDAGIIFATRVPPYLSSIKKYEGNLSDIEQPLKDAVRSFVDLADEIHASQQDMVRSTEPFLNGRQLDALRLNNAPCAGQLHAAVGQLNVVEFACALEGSALDNIAANGACPRSSEVDNRRRIMSNVVNAARPEFLRTIHWRTPLGANSGPEFFDRNFLQELMKDDPDPEGDGSGTNYPVEGWLTDNICNAADHLSLGSASCAQAGGGTYISFGSVIDKPGSSTAGDAIVASSQSGGAHTVPGEEGQHPEYRGLFSQNEPCTNTGNCFINYRLDNEGNGWGQPAVYAHIEQPLQNSTTQQNTCNDQRQHWAVTDGSSIDMDGGHPNRQGRLVFIPSRNGVAVSKALVYFHRMDDWVFPPNLFDPYWRAKLHPFARNEMADVLRAAGHGDVELASNDGVPIEGNREARRRK